jgi:4-amino-4-deoxy-L-arabinose transferase-like glycosyltransferase
VRFAYSALREPRTQFVLLVGLALGLRLYRIADYTTFQGDQGIDALAARHLLVNHVLPIEGPATSAGGVHLGPFYYYLLAAPLLIGRLDPLADAIGMAVLGALATGLLYILARQWFGSAAALAAAALFAVSPAAIEASRSAWNPAPTPFFVLLGLVGLDGFHRHQDGRWLVLVGVALGCVIQLHYFSLGLVLVVFCVAAWLLLRTASWRAAMWGIVGALLGGALLIPLAVHEISAGFPNLHAASSVLGTPGVSDSLPRRVYAVLIPTFVGGFLTAGIESLAAVVTLGLVIALVRGTVCEKTRFACALLGGLLLVMLAQALVYRGPIPQHYLLAYAPVAYLAAAAAVMLAVRWRAHASASVRNAALALGSVLVSGLLLLNLARAPFGDPLHQLDRTETVAGLIQTASGGQPYALWLLADGDSDAAYRFQLERIGPLPVTPAEPRPPQLFVICQARPCDADAVHAAIGPDWASSQIDWRAQSDDVQVARLVSPE